MEKMVKIALGNFKKDRKRIEEALLKMKAEIAGHKHGFFCLGWRHCRKMEKTVAEAEQMIKEYKEAEEGLAKGNYDKAIELLGVISEQIDRSLFQTAKQVLFRRSPRIISNPTCGRRTRQLRNCLIRLQCQGEG